MKVTNKQLGAVYLEVDGLDKERFKELVREMDFGTRRIEYYLNHPSEVYIENWERVDGKFVWISTDVPETESKKITLDELEQLLNQTPQPTHFAISPEDYTEFMKWKDSQQPKLKPIEIIKCLMEDCKSFNGLQNFSIEDYYDYELVCKDYGQFDIIKAKYNDDGFEEEILLIGHWNDGVTE